MCKKMFDIATKNGINKLNASGKIQKFLLRKELGELQK